MRTETLSLKRGSYEGWSSWHITSGPRELVIVPQVGGRLMMRWKGRDLSFVHPGLAGKVVDLTQVDDRAAKRRELGFPLWGGDKTWLAPQERWLDGVPFLDLDSGGYELDSYQPESGGLVARMTSRICEDTGVRITRSLHVLPDDPEWVVSHQIWNTSGETVQWAPWGVHMVRGAGVVYLPRNAASPYPDGVKTFANEGRSSEVRHTVLEEVGSVVAVDCRNSSAAFKFGVDPGEGWMLGVIDAGELGLVGYRKQVLAYPERPYSHGCIAEVYNSDQFPYFEMEIHGPLITLEPGETFALEERQVLFDMPGWPRSEKEVRSYVDDTPTN